LRLKAARAAGLAIIPAVYVDDLSEAQIKAFRIAINRMAELADWDEALLGQELQELRELDFDLDLTGFDTSSIDDFIKNNLAKDDLQDEDVTPPPPHVWGLVK
jgi:ParB-like chromosome segregation protein Spo0J